MNQTQSDQTVPSSLALSPYISLDTLKQEEAIICQNIRSYSRNFSKLQDLLSRNPGITVVALQETWSLMGARQMPGFQPIIAKTRSKKGGGGVAFLVKQGTNFKLLDSPFVEGVFESISISVIFQGKLTQLINVYKPPGSLNRTFLNFATISMSQTRLPKVLLGDLNIDFLKVENSDVNAHFCGLEMGPLIDKPTRVTSNSSSLIDQIFCQRRDLTGFIMESDCSDHYTTGMRARKKDYKTKITQEVCAPLQDPRSLNYLKQFLSCVNWSPVLNDNSIRSFDSFESIMQEATQICCPVTAKAAATAPKEPWFSRGLMTSRFKKEKLHKLARKSKKNSLEWAQFKLFRNLYYRTIRAAKIRHYKQSFFTHQGNGKMTWQLAREVTGHGTRSSQGIGDIENCNSTLEKATAFNKFYIEIAPELASKVPPATTNYLSYLPAIDRDKIPPLQFGRVGGLEVERILGGMMNKVSYSHDNLSNKALKSVAAQISTPLAHLINLSLSLNHVPVSWKTAKVVPLFKSGNSMQTTNYRPISLLSTLSKVLEKCVHNRVYKYLDSNKLIFKHQYGFRARHSCQDLLVKLQQLIFNSKNEKKQCLAIFIDLKKAFDTVNLDILLNKVNHYGLPVEWFRSYLNDRKQYVNLSGVKSTLADILCGVPQGSILGPLLFLIYINDFPDATKLFSLLYADDTTLFSDSDSLEVLINQTNSELLKIEKWFLANRLTLHPAKTRYILFTNSKQPIPPLMLMGQPIQRVHEQGDEKSFKLVGVHLDEGMTWKHHINKVKSKIAGAMALISRSKHYLPREIRVLLYKSLVLCHIDYCNILWGKASPTLLKPIISYQKKALRLACGAKYNSHADPLFGMINSLKFEDLVTFNLVKLGSKAARGNIPNGISSVFTFSTNNHLRSHLTPAFKVPICKTDQTQRMVPYTVPSQFNALPNFFKEGDTSNLENIFKADKINSYLSFECYSKNCYSCSHRH